MTTSTMSKHDLSRPNLITLFEYSPDIRKVIYTTNAIESLNSVIRKATKLRKVFPTDESALKVVYLAIQAASKKWTGRTPMATLLDGKRIWAEKNLSQM